MSETTFNRIRKVIISGYEGEIDPDTIKPESTLAELDLIEFFWGPASTFMDLEDEFIKDYPRFIFPYDDDVIATTTIQQIVDLVEKEIKKAQQEAKGG